MGEPALPEARPTRRGWRELALPYFERRGVRRASRTPRGAGLPGARSCRWRPASVDRLDEIPARLRVPVRLRRRGGAGRSGRAREVLRTTGAREVDRGAGRASCRRRRGCDREAFRAVAARVKQRTGQKGKALFHPIRVALTGDGGRAGAGSRGAGDRARRRAAARRRPRADHRLPRARRGVRGGARDRTVHAAACSRQRIRTCWHELRLRVVTRC